jgi:hypothetical protein
MCLLRETLPDRAYDRELGRHLPWIRYGDTILILSPRRGHRGSSSKRSNDCQRLLATLPDT